MKSVAPSSPRGAADPPRAGDPVKACVKPRRGDRIRLAWSRFAAGPAGLGTSLGSYPGSLLRRCDPWLHAVDPSGGWAGGGGCGRDGKFAAEILLQAFDGIRWHISPMARSQTRRTVRSPALCDRLHRPAVALLCRQGFTKHQAPFEAQDFPSSPQGRFIKPAWPSSTSPHFKIQGA